MRFAQGQLDVFFIGRLIALEQLPLPLGHILVPHLQLQGVFGAGNGALFSGNGQFVVPGIDFQDFGRFRNVAAFDKLGMNTDDLTRNP